MSRSCGAVGSHSCSRALYILTRTVGCHMTRSTFRVPDSHDQITYYPQITFAAPRWTAATRAKLDHEMNIETKAFRLLSASKELVSYPHLVKAHSRRVSEVMSTRLIGTVRQALSKKLHSPSRAAEYLKNINGLQGPDVCRLSVPSAGSLRISTPPGPAQLKGR